MGNCLKCGRKGLLLRIDPVTNLCYECSDTEYNTAMETFSDIQRIYNKVRSGYSNINPDEAITYCDYLFKMVHLLSKNRHVRTIIEEHITYKNSNSTWGTLNGFDYYVNTSNPKYITDILNKLLQEVNSYRNSYIRRRNILLKYAKFNKQLKSLPKHNITLSSTKLQKNSISDLEEIHFSSITASSNYERLGNFVVIDVETTGLSSSRNEIIEVAAVMFEEWEPISKFETLIKPKHEITKEITGITGISSMMVENAPAIHEVIPSLVEFIGNSNIVGHNLMFDMKFLYKNGLNFFDATHKYYDTLELAQKYLKKAPRTFNPYTQDYEIDYNKDYDVENHKLDTLCEFFSIRDNKTSHQAASDCLATGILFNKLIKLKLES